MGMERFVALHSFLHKERKEKPSIPIENHWQKSALILSQLERWLVT